MKTRFYLPDLVNFGEDIPESMKNIYFIILSFIIVCLPNSLSARQGNGTMRFTVSMEQPSNHYFHVEFRCEGIREQTMNFKMPAWTPGYYMILDLAKYVINFQAEDDQGNNLRWIKINKNTWQVETKSVPVVLISYDVFAYVQSVAHPFLDDGRGFISPTGVFMYPDGYLQHPVNVTVKPWYKWHKISTGLERIEEMYDTYYASDFDMLYDCPILAGNQDILSFEVQGIPHYVVMENPVNIDTIKYISDLKKMVGEAVKIIGEIPYKHYTFLIMGEGMGGLEHANSMAVFSSEGRYGLADPESYKSWLAFLAHEYFHLYNVKTIRPVALGPFDYDRENYTNMLWFSEGVTVYYEYLILNRAGFLNSEESLEHLRRDIMNYENIPGHLFQPVTMTSFDTWIQFFNRSENASNTTISYYDKGCALGMLLDLKIRHETQNEKSLDDVMRTLYYEFNKEKGRGFTDHEFQFVCENIAGCTLNEIFEYASTTKAIDYPKYLAYAGLDIDTALHILPGVQLGAKVYEHEGKLIISNVEWNSPAWFSGLSPRDTIIELNSKTATAQLLDEILDSGKPGVKTEITIGRRTGRYNIVVIPESKQQRTFNITRLSQPDPFQVKILNNWLNN
jgi:predicted metalloprotease with PDZ domain